MEQKIRRWMIAIGVLGFCGLCAAEPERDHPIRPVPYRQVDITGGFWKARVQAAVETTLPHVLQECRETGRLSNFEIASGRKQGQHEGRFFNDSDVYKILEGAAYVLNVQPDDELEKFCDDFIDVLAAAQEPDGYLNTHFQLKEEPARRWQNIDRMHELYCAGHLFEAAVAYYQVTGKRRLLDVAIRLADLIESLFGPGRKLDPPGHQGIEIGLIRLHRVTGKKEYLDLARFFLDQRGNANRGTTGKWYHQDHEPLVEQREAVGHAVRAVYGYSAMTDIATLTGDVQHTTAVDRLWKNVVSKKLSLTGGIGGGLWESFDREYFLPNTTAYNETCGAIGNVFWNHRMFLLHGDAEYLDVLERTLYNGALGGVSLAGDRFFYSNRLESRGAERKSWFTCACCPSNIARFIPSVSRYLYATQGEKLLVNLYAQSEVDVEIAGHPVRLRQETDYPWSGRINIHVSPAQEARFGIGLRIPGWAQNRPIPSDLYRYRKNVAEKPSLRVNSESIDLELEKGFAVIRRAWKKGDVIELDLPMPVRRVLAHEALLDDRGLVALERGPLVYCVEGLDIGKQTGEILNVRLPEETDLNTEHRADLLDGVTVITGIAQEVLRGKDKVSVVERELPLVAVPYYARANRGLTPMTVWLLQDNTRAILPPVPTITSTSRASASVENVNLRILNDQIIPARSGDASRGTFTWKGRRGTTEWVQYDFQKSEEVCAVEVYWYARFGTAFKLPQLWQLLYREKGQWIPVENNDPYTVMEDRFNRVTFKSVKTDGLRIKVKLQDQYRDTYLAKEDEKPQKMCGGVLEWNVE